MSENMSENVCAVCSKCNKAVTGKIYEPYWCADCKISDLEDKVNFYKEEYNRAEKERINLVKKYNDELSEKIKYKHAFKALVEEIKG